MTTSTDIIFTAYQKPLSGFINVYHFQDRDEIAYGAIAYATRRNAHNAFVKLPHVRKVYLIKVTLK